MELKDTLKNIYKNLEKFDFSTEQKKALYDYGKALSENEELLARAAKYYTMIFEDKDTVDASELEEHDGLEKGMLFAIIFLARCELLGEVLEKDGIPRQYAQYGIWHYKNLFDRNKQCYGRYGFCGMYRNGMVNYVKPKTFTLGRLSFEMNVFSGPYEVYQNKKSGALIPIAVASLRYLANGKPAPQGASDFFETTLSVGETIEGYTFYEDGTLNFERIILHKDEYVKVLKQGDPVLSVHIPEMGKMTPESVQESFEQAREFFGKYYSHKNFKAFVCSSWLLDTGLKNFLKPESNIMAFQKNFRIALSFVNTFSIYWHIFGVEKIVPYSELVPKNSFQKKILDYVLGGGFLYSGNGFIMF